MSSAVLTLESSPDGLGYFLAGPAHARAVLQRAMYHRVELLAGDDAPPVASSVAVPLDPAPAPPEPPRPPGDLMLVPDVQPDIPEEWS
jgi:hypothetical protein